LWTPQIFLEIDLHRAGQKKNILSSDGIDLLVELVREHGVDGHKYDLRKSKKRPTHASKHLSCLPGTRAPSRWTQPPQRW
jgi:hypothetical protein